MRVRSVANNPRLVSLTLLVFCIVLALPQFAFGQRFGAGMKVSTLGIGIEGAARVTDRSDIRGSFNFYNYNRTFDKDGIDYDGDLRFRSVQITYDQYLAGLFHVSPGILLHNGNRAVADASVPAGQSFSLGDTTFFSNATNPVRGTGTLEVRNMAPMVLAGIGNLLPGNGGRFGLSFDAGIAFQGSPDVSIILTGTACAVNPTTACANAASDPIVQAAIQREQDKIIDDTKTVVKYYPVVSVGFIWKF